MYFANHKLKLFLLLLVALQIISCGRGHKQQESGSLNPAAKKVAPVKDCRGCHAAKPDRDHAVACVVCHKGRERAADKKTAHRGMIAAPSSPANMRICAGCHPRIVARSEEHTSELQSH